MVMLSRAQLKGKHESFLDTVKSNFGDVSRSIAAFMNSGRSTRAVATKHQPSTMNIFAGIAAKNEAKPSLESEVSASQRNNAGIPGMLET